MGNTFVPDLGVYLDDVHLNLWNTSEMHRQHWLTNPPADFGPTDQAESKAVAVSYLKNSRYGRRCLYLLDRTEAVAGCTGWRCEHNCQKELPAVPGVYCQQCVSFVDGGAF